MDRINDVITSNNKFVRYGGAVVLSAAALLLTRWTSPYIKNDAFDFFQGAVFLTALYGGLGPSILTSFLSIAALDYFFLPPLNAWVCGVADIPRLGVFALVAIVTSSLSARLKRTQHELAKEVVDASQREQRRLGQDLHDGLCQLLVGIKLLAENVKNKLAATAPMEAVEINEIENRLSEALAQADGISRGLYPVELDADDLKGELESLLKKLSSLYGIRCALIFDRPPLFVDPLMAAHVYRMAQEGVINAAKGGKAKNVQVRLTTRAANGVLEVADDGIGFDGHPQRQGMGLRILNYRAQILNGTLRYDPRPGGGTLMSCAWRINNESENKDSRR